MIYLPLAQQYPNGYTVSVSGAHVVSTPGASRLELANVKGIHPVTVTVIPAAGPVIASRPNLAACPG